MTGTGTIPAPFAGTVLEQVECLTLGPGVILHNRESGALLATNAFGAMLFDALGGADTADDAIKALAAELAIPEDDVAPAVQETLTRWTDDGLFLSEPPPFPAPVAHRSASRDSDTRHFALDRRHVTLVSEDPVLAADIARAIAPMGLGRDTPDKAPADAVQLDVLVEDGAIGVFRDRAAVWGAASYELSRFHLLREIMDALAGPERIAAQLHASAVAKRGRGLVFAGASGSGKSTLAAALTATGAALAADDHVALGLDGGHLLAFPTRPNLKPGAAEIAELRGALQRPDSSPPDFVPATTVPVGSEIALAGFVFPEYAAGAQNALIPLEKTEALQRLVQTGSRVSRTTRSIAPLVSALETRPTFRLSYSDTVFALSACHALLDP